MVLFPDIPSISGIRYLENPPDTCQAAHAEQQWPTKILIPLSFPLAAILLAFLVYRLIYRLRYWRHVRKGSKAARIAAIVLKEFRTSCPEVNHPTRHTWSLSQDIDTTTPLLCVSCAENITAMTPADTLQSCAVCGAISHEACLRHVGDTCRPLSTRAASIPSATNPSIDNSDDNDTSIRANGSDFAKTSLNEMKTQEIAKSSLGPPHYWAVAGTCKEERRAGDFVSTDAQPCLYCGEAVSSEMHYAMEPAWCCTCCACCAHVQCFSIAHPELVSVKNALETSIKKQDTSLNEAKNARRNSSEYKSYSNNSSALPSPSTMPLSSPVPASRSYEEQQLRRTAVITRASVSKLDVCSLGPLGKMVLPSHCIDKKPKPKKPSPSSFTTTNFILTPSSLLSPKRTSSQEIQMHSSTQHLVAATAAAQQHTSAVVHSKSSARGNSIAVPAETAEGLVPDSVEPGVGQPPSPTTASNNATTRALSSPGATPDSSRATSPSALPVDVSIKIDSKPSSPFSAAENVSNNLLLQFSQQQQQQQQQLSLQRNASSSSSVLEDKQPKDAHKHKKGSQVKSQVSRHNSWWRKAFASRLVQWQDWRLHVPLPPPCRPVLVFINVNSGPRAGSALRRRFLRVLHPLQVVTLPKESPEDALRLFMHVPGLRILCVGGDGTAGWVMSCLDAIAEDVRSIGNGNGAGGPIFEDSVDGTRIPADDVSYYSRHPAPDDTILAMRHTRESQRQPVEWVPPPVAVMPLGTGNDLARCLGWGGSYNQWRQDGPLHILDEVSQATITLLDRWSLTFTESPATFDCQGENDSHLGDVEKRKSKEWNDSSSHEDDPDAIEWRSSKAIPLPLQQQQEERAETVRVLRKSMNNYLGIGVDAKVALEFHEMRESYPQWFQSQIGNKLVYTGVGALDIVGVVGGGQISLGQKIAIECDGVTVRLPEHAEGILVVNIPSYMGGVNLWATGGSGRGSHGGKSGSDTRNSLYNNNNSSSGDNLRSIDGGSGSSTPPNRNTHAAIATPLARGKQSICDGMLELVAVYGSWHLGQLTVGLSGAVRLCQARSITIKTIESLPMQVDGEPFMQHAGQVTVELQGRVRVLKRAESKQLARIVGTIEDVLEEAVEKKVINPIQHDQLSREMAARLQLHKIE